MIEFKENYAENEKNLRNKNLLNKVNLFSKNNKNESKGLPC